MIVLELYLANGVIMQFERGGDLNFLLECIKAEMSPIVSSKFVRR